MINGLGFILGLLALISLDLIFGFILFLIWKVLDLKYFRLIKKFENRNFWED